MDTQSLPVAMFPQYTVTGPFREVLLFEARSADNLRLPHDGDILEPAQTFYLEVDGTEQKRMMILPDVDGITTRLVIASTPDTGGDDPVVFWQAEEVTRFPGLTVEQVTAGIVAGRRAAAGMR